MKKEQSEMDVVMKEFYSEIKPLFMEKKCLRLSVDLNEMFDRHLWGAKIYANQFFKHIMKTIYYEEQLGRKGVIFYAKSFLSDAEMAELLQSIKSGKQ